MNENLRQRTVSAATMRSYATYYFSVFSHRIKTNAGKTSGLVCKY